jgi:large subunit ribosomal protein L5
MATTPKAYQPRLKIQYSAQWSSELKNDFSLSNINQAPRLEKVLVSVGLGRAKDDKKVLETAANTLRKITGQNPVNTVARKSIASFKLREGNTVGLMVTLRGDKMYEFTDRLINIVLPRLRDFHGVSNKSFDKQGNYSIGLPDQSAFPELSFEDTTTPHGLQVTFVIKSLGPEQSKGLLEKMGLPFEKENR